MGMDLLERLHAAEEADDAEGAEHADDGDVHDGGRAQRGGGAEHHYGVQNVPACAATAARRGFAAVFAIHYCSLQSTI